MSGSNMISDLFGNVAVRGFLVRARSLLAVVALVPLAAFMQPRLLPISFAVSMFGQLIQTWCFASLVKNRELTTRGPYVFVRNPMYLGRYFLLLGFVILPGNWIIVAAYTVIYYLYMVNRVKREETRLQRNFGEDYARYRREVRSFLPTIGLMGKREVWFFDWAMFRENNAHWNLLGTFGAYVVVFLAQRFLFV